MNPIEQRAFIRKSSEARREAKGTAELRRQLRAAELAQDSHRVNSIKAALAKALKP